MLIGFIGVALLVTPHGAGKAFDARFVIGALVIQAGASPAIRNGARQVRAG